MSVDERKAARIRKEIGEYFLTGKSPSLRPYLCDPDPDVRAVASEFWQAWMRAADEITRHWRKPKEEIPTMSNEENTERWMMAFQEYEQAHKSFDSFSQSILTHVAAAENDIKHLRSEIETYHDALSSVLPLFVLDRGFDYNCVNASLKALALHPELPTDATMAQKIREMGYNKETSDGKPRLP